MFSSMKFILGEKKEMSQMFDREGNVIPVTLIQVPINVVVQVKTKEKDGYRSVQVGVGTRKEKNINKPQKGHFRGMGNFRYTREFRVHDDAYIMPHVGEKMEASLFQEGEQVRVSGISKSKGFQGVMKRHGFHGAPATHGTKHAHREPGAIGGAGGRAGGRVAKGMRMAGRMGGDRTTVKNLKVVMVDAEQNMLALRGAVPGRRGTLLAMTS